MLHCCASRTFLYGSHINGIHNYFHNNIQLFPWQPMVYITTVLHCYQSNFLQLNLSILQTDLKQHRLSWQPTSIALTHTCSHNHSITLLSVIFCYYIFKYIRHKSNMVFLSSFNLINYNKHSTCTTF